MKTIRTMTLTLLLLPQPALAAHGVVDQLLADYRAAGAEEFSAARGEKMWTAPHPRDGGSVSCATCHTEDLTAAGEHVRTGKRIEPLAVRANPERLTDAAKVEKWFARNCRWTLGRACTPREKGDFLRYILER